MPVWQTHLVLTIKQINYRFGEYLYHRIHITFCFNDLSFAAGRRMVSQGPRVF